MEIGDKAWLNDGEHKRQIVIIVDKGTTKKGEVFYHVIRFNNESIYLRERDLEAYSEEKEKPERKYKIGDKVHIKRNGHFHTAAVIIGYAKMKNSNDNFYTAYYLFEETCVSESMIISEEEYSNQMEAYNETLDYFITGFRIGMCDDKENDNK